ncbi:TetR/AcrR family transcriptional regulator [Steroidobacter flavus]|uniref:TetR/AcrR family transcriptional regulator n=1 Tax=Steroidobacter flavus TaxID=1842136 RepID=A0ABV8SZH1_9GAMM
MLATVGYEGVTFEGVAESVGCSRATLYRRFTSRFELVADTINATLDATEPTTPLDNRSARENLLWHARTSAEFMREGHGRALMSLSEAGNRNPELSALMARREQRAKDFYYAEFRRVRGGLTQEKLAFAFDTLIGSILYHETSRNRRLSTRQLEALVDCTIAILRDETTSLGA